MEPAGHGRIYNVLFLCTGNSARSIMAEALVFDFVITVCDTAAGKICPIWPGHPVTAHWGVDDPAAMTGTDAEKLQAFRDAFRALEHRVRIFVNLPIATLDRLPLQQRLDELGRQQPGP
jgi:arsenate reductase